MSDNLITLDLGGLLTQLNDIGEGVTELQAKVQSHTKLITESDKQFKTFKDKSSDTSMSIRTEIKQLVESFESTNSNMKEMDALFFKLKENLKLQDQKETKQKAFNTDLDQRVTTQKQVFDSYKKSNDEQVSQLTLKTDFTQATSELTDRVTKVETGTNETTSNLKGVDDQLQELIDRVETIETHGVQPQRPASSPIAINNEVCETGELRVDDEVITEEVQVIDPKLLQEIKKFARTTLDENDSFTRLELFNATVEHFEKLRQAEKDKLLAVDEQYEYGAEKEPEEKPEPNLLYECHLPSKVENTFETHLKSVGTKLVWLETIKPKFQMEDGRLQLGSDYEQVFAHVEVQTFQQQQLLKMKQQDTLTINELRQELDEMKELLKDEGRRIQQLELGADIDLSHLNVDNAGLKELFRLMQDLKTDILQKSVSNDDIKNIKKDFEQLRQQTKTASGSIDPNLRENITLALGQMAEFPSQLRSLQVQLMKGETLCYDVDRTCQTLIQRVDAMEAVGKSLTEILPQQTDSQSEDALEKMKELAAVKYYCSTQFVTKDQYKNFTESTNTNFQALDTLNRVAQENQQKILDNSKLFRKNQQELQQIMGKFAEMTQRQKIIAETQQTKVSNDVFNEELGYLKHMVNNIGKGKKAADSSGPQSSIQSRMPPPGGMSAAMKNQIKEMSESVERHENLMQNIQRQFRELNLQELQNKVTEASKELPQKVPKSDFEQLQHKLVKDLLSVKSQMKDYSDTSEKQQLKIDQRLEQFNSLNQERDSKLEDFSSNFERIDYQIQVIKKNNAGPSKLMRRDTSPQTLTLQNALNSDEEGPSTQKLRDDLYQFQKAVKLKQETTDYKLRLLWPLVDGDVDEKDKSGKTKTKSDLETRLSEKIFITAAKQSEETFKLKTEVDELKKTFEEKIRRQALVRNKKQSPHQDNDELKKSTKRPKFLAQQMTRELVVNGRLPQFENYGDHIARYGKGFSQMLNMAMMESPQEHAFSPRLQGGVSLGELSNSYEYEGTQGTDQILGNFLTQKPTFEDTISNTSAHKQHRLHPATSHKEIQITENAPTIEGNLTSRVHPSTKGLIFNKKLADNRQGNLTTIEHPIIDQEQGPWKQTGSQFLPMISTSRSITQVQGDKNEV